MIILMSQSDAEQILYGAMPVRTRSDRGIREHLLIEQAIPAEAYTLRIKDGSIDTLLNSYTVCICGEYAEEAGDPGWCGAYGWLSRGCFPLAWQDRRSERVNLSGWMSAGALAKKGLSALSGHHSPITFKITHDDRWHHDRQLILAVEEHDPSLNDAAGFICAGAPAAVEALSPYDGRWIFSMALKQATGYDLAYIMPEQEEILGFARTTADREELVEELEENMHFHNRN